MVQPVMCPSLAPKKSGGIPLLRRQKTQTQVDDTAAAEYSKYSPVWECDCVKIDFLIPFLSLSLSLSFFLSLSLSRMIDALRNETNLFLTESLTPSEVASLSSTNLMIISLWYQVYSLWFVIFILKIWGRFLCITAKGLQEERKLNCRDEGDDRSGIGASRMKQIAWNWWITILKFKPDGLEFNSGSISVLQFNIPACTEV